MKWNFECCARKGDYLHDRIARRRNDFRAHIVMDAPSAQIDCTVFERFTNARAAPSTATPSARCSLSPSPPIQFSVSLTAIALLIDFIKHACASMHASNEIRKKCKLDVSKAVDRSFTAGASVN
jgi:hypothetical protein